MVVTWANVVSPLPVYVLLIGLLVDDSARVGPFGARG
jgi:hypothetical protein